MSISDGFPYSDGALSGQAAWSVVTYGGSLQVASTAIAGAADDTTRANLRTDSWNTTQSSTIQVVTAGANAYPGAIVHGTDSGSGLVGYAFGVEINSSGVFGNFYLERIANGTTAETLDTGSSGGGSPAGVTIGIGIDGDDVVGYLGGVEIARGTNTAHRAGKPGVLLYHSSGSSVPVLDNWVGTGEAGAAGGILLQMLMNH